MPATCESVISLSEWEKCSLKMVGLNKSVLQVFLPKHIYRSIHETARSSSVIVLCLSFLGVFFVFCFFWCFLVFFVVWWFGVFLCKYKCFMDYNKISLSSLCRLKHIYTFAVLIKRNLPEGVQIKMEPAGATANTRVRSAEKWVQEG